MTQPAYAIPVTINLGFDAAVDRVTALLKEEGFGVLSTIDVAATLKKKLDADMPPYVILGACNPGFAQQAVQAEPTIGVLLPCNVVVRSLGDGQSEVILTRVQGVFSLVDAPGMSDIASEVGARMSRVAAALSS